MIKQEIKEELLDDIYTNSEEIYDESMMLEMVKYEEDEDQPNDENLNTSEIYSKVIKPNQSNQVTCDDDNFVENDDLYVDGEREVFIANLNQNYSKESTSDPLAFHAAPESIDTEVDPHKNSQLDPPSTDSNHKKVVRVRVLRTPKVPPLNKLVYKTYSQEHRTAPSKRQIHSCSTCKKIFGNLNQLREHERNCFKCEQCNLIVISMEYLVNHLTKCRRKKDEHKLLSKRLQNTSGSIEKKSCNICYISFVSDDDMEEHQKQNHTIPNAYACHLCESKFDSEFEAHQHLGNAH